MNFSASFRDHDTKMFDTRDNKTLVALDPGEVAGIAVFDLLTGELICAGASRKTQESRIDPVDGALESIRETISPFQWGKFGPDDTSDRFNVCVYERPVIRKGSPVKSSDIITLSLSAGAAAAAINARDYVAREPHAWKGGVDGEAFVAIIRDRWTFAHERERVFLPRARSLQHNVWDAVGLGVHYLRGVGKRQ